MVPEGLGVHRAGGSRQEKGACMLKLSKKPGVESKWARRDYKHSKPIPSDILSPARLHPLKVPQPRQTVLSTEDQVFKYLNQKQSFLIQTTTLIKFANS